MTKNALAIVVIGAAAAFAVPQPVVRGAVYVSGRDPDPTTTCRAEWPTEQAGVALFPQNGTTMRLFSLFNGNRANRSLGAWSNFAARPSAVNFDRSSVSPLVGLGGDPWADQTSNVIYASFIGDTPSGQCTAVAVTSPAYYENNNRFEHPARCIAMPPTLGDDHPAIAVSHAWSRFYAATAKMSGQYLYIGKDCQIGAPVGCCVDAPCTSTCSASGNERCPITSYFELPHNFERPTVDINPCTGNAIVIAPGDFSGSDPVTATIRLYAVDGDGVVRADTALISGVAHEDQVGCGQGMGGGQVRGCLEAGCDRGCDDTFFRAMVKIKKRNDDRCYAYFSYDYTTRNGPQRWYKTRLYIYDLGTASAPKEANPTYLAAWQSTSDAFTWNQWKPQLIVSDSAAVDSVGWFWYSDNFGPCNTYFEGARDADGGFSKMAATGRISAFFPIQEYGTRGLGEYHMGVGYDSVDGTLHPIWTQPVATTATCNTCNGRSWSVTAQTTQVMPDEASSSATSSPSDPPTAGATGEVRALEEAPPSAPLPALAPFPVDPNCAAFARRPLRTPSWWGRGSSACVMADLTEDTAASNELYGPCQPQHVVLGACPDTLGAAFCHQGRMTIVCGDDKDCPGGSLCSWGTSVSARTAAREGDIGTCERTCQIDADCGYCNLRCDKSLGVCAAVPAKTAEGE